jgi:hypothetical protein
MPGGSKVELRADYPWPNISELSDGIDVMNLCQVLRTVEDQGCSQCRSGETGPAPSRDHWNAKLSRGLDDRQQIFVVAGDYDPEGLDAVVGGVG